MADDDLARMRAFVAAVMHGRAIPAEPPIALVKAAHLGPIAYRRGSAALRAEYAASMIMAERRARMLGETVTAFARRGIEVALLKGISFVGNIYPDPAERPMNDVDVLVRVNQLPAATDALRELGFVRHGYERKLSDYYHAMAWKRGDMMIELHRHMVQRFRTRVSLEDIWARATRDDQGSGALRLERIDELLMCILHVARSEMALPALNYLDVWRLWQRLDETQRAELHGRARTWRIERAVGAVLAMTELLAAGTSGHPGSAILPSSDDVLLATPPVRSRQIAQKLWLTEGPREILGLGFSYVAAIVEGWYRARSGTRPTPG